MLRKWERLWKRVEGCSQATLTSQASRGVDSTARRRRWWRAEVSQVSGGAPPPPAPIPDLPHLAVMKTETLPSEHLGRCRIRFPSSLAAAPANCEGCQSLPQAQTSTHFPNYRQLQGAGWTADERRSGAFPSVRPTSNKNEEKQRADYARWLRLSRKRWADAAALELHDQTGVPVRIWCQNRDRNVSVSFWFRPTSLSRFPARLTAPRSRRCTGGSDSADIPGLICLPRIPRAEITKTRGGGETSETRQRGSAQVSGVSDEPESSIGPETEP